jgi:TAG lipase / steryl ester hydrolase / phospholipase A2 / LPA acyltransferase
MAQGDQAMKTKTGTRNKLAGIEDDLGAARSYADWLEIAGEHDRLSGAAAWREDDRTDLLHVPEIRKSIATLKALRESGATWPLTKKLQEVLFRHQGEFTHPELYHVARTGTKRVVSEFLDEVEACVHYLIALEVDGVGDDYKLDQLKRVGRVYGRPALMLSGGGTLGIYHVGVIKALFERDLLPRTISGSSMGAIIAAWACCHDDAALRVFFANPHLIQLEALNRLPLKEMLAQRAVFDQAWMLNYLRALMPDMTFAESMRHSRRILNISVSPHKTIQSARLLNFLSSPEALVHQAALASCAIPGAFRPVQLMARQRGQVVPWMEGELWVDGSVNNDLPFAHLAQILNINHFITSQANPHIVPFLSLSGGKSGRMAALARMTGSIAMHNSSQILEVARKHAPYRLVRDALSAAHAVTSQPYAGTDMHIQLPFKPQLFARVMKNPTLEQFEQFILLGEQATWPQIPMINDRTRISRLIGTYIGRLMQRIAAQSAPESAPRKTKAKSPRTRSD